MSFLGKIAKTFDSINNFIGTVFGTIIVALVILTVMEVILRKFLNSPTIWSFEVLKQLFAVYFMITAGYGLLKGAHVSVDIFTQMMSEKGKAILSIVSYLIFFFPFCCIGAWYGYQYAATSWRMSEHSWSTFAPPLYPIKAVICITFALLIMQGIAEVIKEIFKMKGLSYDGS
ncbi:MAG: TRAP transporter small permease subunit [Desulfopila sp.]